MKIQIIAMSLLTIVLAGCRSPRFQTKDEIEARLKDFGLTARSLHAYPSGDTHLELSRRDLTDISALRGMKLSSLAIHQNRRLVDLSPLRDMPLRTLWIEDTAVSDLTPLSGMPLETLYMINTKVEDISPLAGMPLNTLFIFGSPVKDLSPLKNMPLQMLSFTPHHVTNGIDVVRSIESLRFISTGGAGSKVPAREFWEQYDVKKTGERAEPEN